MALNSSSRAQLVQQSAEKSSSPLGKLKKVFSGSASSAEKPKKQKLPAMKHKKSPARLSWSTDQHESSGSLTLSTMTTSATASTTRTNTVVTIAFPPEKHADIAIPVPAVHTAYPPAQSSPVKAPESAAQSSPRFTDSEKRSPAPHTEKTSSVTPEGSHGPDEARRLFSLLEKHIEHFLWHPSSSSLRQLGNTMKQMNASGLNFTKIDASSLVLRILVDPGKENLDKVIDWIAKLGCPLVSDARKFGLERSSVLERAVERGWPLTANAIAGQLRQEKTLRDHTENMLARAMQSGRPISFLEKALQFSSDYCPLENGITVKMIAILMKGWQFDQGNDLHGAKFVALFNEAMKQGLNTLPVATLLQAATKFHHASMALTMLQLNANIDYLDEDGKTATDLALEAQQRLIEKIDTLRTQEKNMDPDSFQVKMSKYQQWLRSNQCILDALDAVASPGKENRATPSE